MLDGNSFNVSSASPRISFYESGLLGPLITLGVILVTGLVMLYNRLFGRVLVDKQGNNIPDGPRGLPIVGESKPMPPSLVRQI